MAFDKIHPRAIEISDSLSKEGVASSDYILIQDETTNDIQRIKTDEFDTWRMHCPKYGENRRNVSDQFAASGFVHFGLTGGAGGANYQNINEGLYTLESSPYLLRMGRRKLDGFGESKVPYPMTHIAGFLTKIIFANDAVGEVSYIKFPEAPDGTVTYNTTTGVATQHPDVATAFAFANAADIEVVINRVDMFGFEFFLEEVSQTNPFVYPYGCIQSQATTMEGIPTTTSNRPVTYYAVYDGDVTTVGKGINFWSLTNEQKAKVVSNPDHNIFMMEDGRIVQWRVRQRTIAGAGNGGTPDASYGVDGECYFLVCGTVPRLNQGAYHPSFNPMGAKLIKNKADSNHGFWYESTANQLTNVQQAFTLASTVANSGAIGGVSGRPDGKFYNAIYASGQGGVIDYRLSAWDMSSKEEASKIFQKVVDGSYRGEELLTKTKVFGSAQGATYQGVVSGMYKWNASAADFVISDGALGTSGASAPIIGWLVQESKVFPVTYLFQASGSSTTQIYCGQSAWENTKPNGVVQDIVSNKPMYFVQHITTNIPVSGDFTQVDLFAEPSVILNEASFKNGWLGGWAGMPSSAPAGDIDFTRKVKVGTPTRIYKFPSGAWSSGEMPNFNSILNGSTRGWSSDKTLLYTFTYTAFAKQTKPSTDKPVLNGSEGVLDVLVTSSYEASKGVLLNESLTGKINIGTDYRLYRPLDYVLDNGFVSDINTSMTALPTGASEITAWQISNNGQLSLQFNDHELAIPYGYIRSQSRAGGQIQGAASTLFTTTARSYYVPVAPYRGVRL